MKLSPDFWWLYREIRVPDFLMANKLIVLVEINWESLAVSYLFVCFFPTFILGEKPRSWKCHAVWEGDSLFSLIQPLFSSHFCDVNLRVCFVEGKKRDWVNRKKRDWVKNVQLTSRKILLPYLFKCPAS